MGTYRKKCYEATALAIAFTLTSCTSVNPKTSETIQWIYDSLEIYGNIDLADKYARTLADESLSYQLGTCSWSSYCGEPIVRKNVPKDKLVKYFERVRHVLNQCAASPGSKKDCLNELASRYRATNYQESEKSLFIDDSSYYSADRFALPSLPEDMIRQCAKLTLDQDGADKVSSTPCKVAAVLYKACSADHLLTQINSSMSAEEKALPFNKRDRVAAYRLENLQNILVSRGLASGARGDDYILVDEYCRGYSPTKADHPINVMVKEVCKSSVSLPEFE